MNLRSHILACTAALVLALLLGSALVVVADPHYAVAASTGKVFLITYDNGTVSSSILSQLSSSSLTGIATWSGHDNQVFVADAASQGDTVSRTLRAGKIVNIGVSGISPSIQWMNDPIPLTQTSPAEQIKDPGTVQVDTSGKVYVAGSRWRDSSNAAHSGYACVTPGNNWEDALGSTVEITSRSTAILADITLNSADQPFIAMQDTTTTWAGESCAALSALDPVVQAKGYFPQAIAAGSSHVYMANYSTEINSDYGPTEIGSISCMTETLAQTGDIIQLDSFRPTDIAFFTTDGNSYLGLVGATTSGQSQAWRIQIEASTGIPQLSSAKTCNLDSSAIHYCAVSPDGAVFWATNAQAGTVTAIDTLTWTASVVPNLGVSVGRIAAFVPATTVIPKPWLSDISTQLYQVGKPFVGPRPQFISGQAGSTFTATGLPGSDWTCDPNTGVVSWPTPTKSSHPYTVTITATNDGGSGSTQYLLSQIPKQAEDADEVATARVAVTARYDDGFCVESLDRLWGMYVMQSSSTVSVGQLVDVRGHMQTDESGNRYISPSSITRLSGSKDIDPIYIPMRSLCGGDFLRSYGPTSGQRGVTGGFGLNNVGLYVKVSGTVKTISSDGLEITVDDGSNTETTIDLTMAVDGLEAGDYVKITGISRLLITNNGATYIRGLRTRDIYGLEIVPTTQTQP